MRRLISLLLIPMFVLGQALPHSHAESGIIAPDKHGERPHVHVSVHHHQHHGNEHGHHLPSPEDESSKQESHHDSTTDHESDAVYLVDCDLAGDRSADSLDLNSLPLGWSIVDLTSDTVSGEYLEACDPPDKPPGALPVYLLTASLRL